MKGDKVEEKKVKQVFEPLSHCYPSHHPVAKVILQTKQEEEEGKKLNRLFE